MSQSTENKENKAPKVENVPAASAQDAELKAQAGAANQALQARALPDDLLRAELERRGVRFDPEETERVVSQNERLSDDPERAARFDPPMIRDDSNMMTRLLNPDPRRKYTLVYKADRTTFAIFRSMGYVVERHSENGVKLLIGETGQSGDEIEFNGHILMSISRAQYDRQYKQGGNFGGLGQNHWDQLEKKIRSKKLNPVKGLPGSDFMGIDNTTTDFAVR